MTSPTSMTQSAAMKVPTREQCIEAVYHLENAAKKALLGYYLHGDGPEEELQEDRRVYHASEIFRYLKDGASALGLRLSADEPVAKVPDWKSIYEDCVHEPDRDQELLTITRETARLARNALQQTNAADYYHNNGAAQDELSAALSLTAQPPTFEPRFSTAWEREDYEREKRGERPLGPFPPAAQQPQSDLVKRLRGMKWASGRPFIHPDITEAADCIEALEAAAAQPSADVERLIGVLAEVEYQIRQIADGCNYTPPSRSHYELSLSDVRHELQDLTPFIADHIHKTKPPHEYSSPAVQPEREKALYDIRWARDDGELLGCHGLTARTVFSRLRGAIANSGPITVHSIEPAAYAPAKAEKS